MDFGSFGNISPEGMAAVKNALARRQQGEGVPALNQQSGVSPTASPTPPQPTGGVAPAPLSTPTAPAGGAQSSEARLIISALKERLKAISNMEGGQPAL